MIVLESIFAHVLHTRIWTHKQGAWGTVVLVGEEIR